MNILYINTFDPYKESHGGATVTRKELELVRRIGRVTTLFGEPLRRRIKKINPIRFCMDLIAGKSVKLATYSILHRPSSFYKQFDVILCNHDMAAYDFETFLELGKPFIVRKLNSEHLFYSENLIHERFERNRIMKFEEALGKSAAAIIHISCTEYTHDNYSRNKHILLPPLLSDVASDDSDFLSTYRYADRHIDILCVTNYEWGPNREGFDWFFDEVAPLLPHTINIHLVGKGSDRYRKYCSVVSHGYVDDVMTFYRTAKLFISPILSGAGIKIKNLEAMVFGTPVISTPLGIDGLDGIETCGGVSVSQTPVDFAEKIKFMLANENCCAIQRSLARDWTVRNVLGSKEWYDRMRELLERATTA